MGLSAVAEDLGQEYGAENRREYVGQMSQKCALLLKQGVEGWGEDMREYQSQFRGGVY